MLKDKIKIKKQRLEKKNLLFQWTMLCDEWYNKTPSSFIFFVNAII